jgi:O-antigen ligase
VYCGTSILVMVTSLILSGSRSGMAGLVIAFVVFAALAGGGARRAAPRLIVVAGVVVLLTTAVVWAGVSRTAARFDQTGVEFADRLAVWRDTTAVIRDFPFTGTGIGSFGSAMLIYQTAGRHSIYEQAHNEYLQILAEGGLLVAIPVLVAVGVLLTTVRRRLADDDRDETRWLRAGAVASLAGIAAQSMVEFSLQIPGNAAMCVFVLAMTLHRSSSHAHAPRV